jgi:hypothetical protein
VQNFTVLGGASLNNANGLNTYENHLYLKSNGQVESELLQKGISDFPIKVGILPLAVVNENPLQENMEDPRVRTD